FIACGIFGLKPAVNAEGKSTKNRESENGDDDALPCRRRKTFDGIDDGRSYRYVNLRGDRRLRHWIGSLHAGSHFACLRVGNKRGVGFGIVCRLAPLKPLIQFAGVRVDGRFLLMFVAPDGKPVALLPTL